MVKRAKLYGLIGIVVSLLSGCTQYHWVNPHKNTQQYNEDRYNCTLESTKIYPPNFQTVTKTQGYLQTNPCDGKDAHIPECKKTRYIEPVTEVIDVNENNREALEHRCMQVKGWRWEKIEKK